MIWLVSRRSPRRARAAPRPGRARCARRASRSVSPAWPSGAWRRRSSSSAGSSAAAVAVAGEEAGEAFRAEASGVGGAGVALEEGERDRRVDVGEIAAAPGQNASSWARSWLASSTLAARPGPRGRGSAPAAPWSRRCRGRAAGSGGCRCAPARRARRRRSRRTCRRRRGSGRGPPRPGWDGPRPLAVRQSSSRSTTIPSGRSIATRSDAAARAARAARQPVLVVRQRRSRAAAVLVDHASRVVLARPVDPGSAPASLLLRRVAGCGPTGRYRCGVLIGRRSAAQRPVAAPGASHRREALVSCGPSARQATRRSPGGGRPYWLGSLRSRPACGQARTHPTSQFRETTSQPPGRITNERGRPQAHRRTSASATAPAAASSPTR